MSILFAILLFSFLIFIHEFGHFIAAKLSNVQVNEFSLFMGPAIFKKQHGETLYALRCIKDLNIPLKHKVRLILGTAEETGSTDIEYY